MNPLKTGDIYAACANSVYQAVPRGEGPGNEANPDPTFLCSEIGVVVGYVCKGVVEPVPVSSPSGVRE